MGIGYTEETGVSEKRFTKSTSIHVDTKEIHTNTSYKNNTF